jgi:short-subunit dehydrogenase involved in D-alanine esterification of teichoic acids
MHVSSTRAMQPAVLMPSYCVGKAGDAPWTQSLRSQSRHRSLRGIEIAPLWI